MCRFVNMDKKELRRVLRRMSREDLTPEMREKASEHVCNMLAVHPRFRDAKNVGLYMALPDEPDVSSLIRQSEKEKNISVPRVIDEEIIRFYRLTGNTELCADNKFGIEEPGENEQTLVDPQELDLIVVPALCFDKKGYRLGRGKGYYDRFLALCPQAYKIGVTIGMMSVEELPGDPWDLPMHEVISGM